MTRIARLFTALALGLSTAGCASLGYYAQAIGGQLDVLSKSRPIEELLAEPATAPRKLDFPGKDGGLIKAKKKVIRKPSIETGSEEIIDLGLVGVQLVHHAEDKREAYPQ